MVNERDPAAGEDSGESPDSGDSARREGNEFSGGLESLLEEEGLGDLEMAELFGEESESPEKRRSASGLSAREFREERRRRDQQDFKDLEGVMVSGQVDLLVSEDRMVARINQIGPGTTYEAIEDLLQRYGIVHGVDYEVIQGALVKASRGPRVHGVVVARGTPPQVIQEGHIQYRFGLDKQNHSFARLQELLLEAPTVEGFSRWQEPMTLVSQGDVLAEMIPPEVVPGRDIFGEPVVLEREEGQTFWAGDNTSLEADGRCCRADIFGYAGLFHGEPIVLPPLWVSPDKMEVRFIYLPAATVASHPPTVEEIHRLLQLRWIEYGIMEEEIARLCARLQRQVPLPPSILIARGDRAVDGEEAQVHFAFDRESSLSWLQLTNLLAARSAEVLQASLAEWVEGAGGISLGQMVHANQVLAEKIPPTEGVNGRDVEGEELIPEEGKDRSLEAGENVQMTEDGRRCLAGLAGYACLRLDQVHVVPPVWVAPDRTAAYFINLPQSPPAVYPTLEEIYGLVQHGGIKHGFYGGKWEAIAAALAAGQLRELLIPIATATPAQPGRDAAFEWAIEVERNQVGKVLEDGSIDFRERNLTTVVREGQLIGKLVAAREGTPGVDVLGNILHPARPVNIEVLTDARIYTQEVEGGIGFFAETGGE